MNTDFVQNVSVIDIGASLVICLSTLRGFFRGLTGEIAQLIGLIAALVGGLLFRVPVSRWLGSHTRLDLPVSNALAFTAVIVGILLALLIIGFVLRKIMKVVFEPGVDKPAGGLAGFASGLIIVFTIFMIMNLWPHDYLNRKFGEDSIIGRQVVKWAPKVTQAVEALPPPVEMKEGIREATEL